MTHATTPYVVGQRWQAQGRHAEEQPMVVIRRIDAHPLGGYIFHVSLDALQIQHPGLPNGVMTQLAHAPMVQQGLDASGLHLIDSVTLTTDARFEQGYQEWKQAFIAGNAGAFGTPVAEVISIVQRRLLAVNGG